MRVDPIDPLITYLVPIWWNYWGKIGRFGFVGGGAL